MTDERVAAIADAPPDKGAMEDGESQYVPLPEYFPRANCTCIKNVLSES